MKTDLPNQEKTLMLLMIVTYWTVILIICWFSYESITQFVVHTFSQARITAFSRP
ncbi:MAG: hypothetical protein ABIN80_31350 [Dyadobacter sp.]|uniref:hypothetical protein n=1 Tax=Dyadobacter sp. TaxID=1914288 RepID=UPI0032645B47